MADGEPRKAKEIAELLRWPPGELPADDAGVLLIVRSRSYQRTRHDTAIAVVTSSAQAHAIVVRCESMKGDAPVHYHVVDLRVNLDLAAAIDGAEFEAYEVRAFADVRGDMQ